ncbi:MAG: aspartate aminotransferase family protein, partial [Deltaproteobacteria bacterium]
MSDTVQKEGLDAETIRKYEAEYVLTPWTAQKGLKPFVAAKAKGWWVYNSEG